MSETITQPSAGTSIHPSDVLMALIVNLLAPMFVTSTGGDIALARKAVIDTIGAYRARSLVDLMAIAQIIGCGLASLSSTTLSLAGDVPIPLMLRLRGNAIGLNRVIEQNRRALAEARAPQPDDIEPCAPPDLAYEAEVMADLAKAKELAAEAVASFKTPQPAPSAIIAPPPAEPPPADRPKTTAPGGSERAWQINLAGAMTRVAGQFTSNLDKLSPAEREIANRRAAMLTSAATEVLLGDIPPRLQAGDLDPTGRPNWT